jgi:PAS domain S-box-containing protein
MREMAPEELIVSKTDPKGIITYANDVFCRMACLSETELLGQPHNIIRHPDMPRTVFKYLWDTLEQKQEVFAYVLNLAGDGVGYWVFAHVTPTVSQAGVITGHHSNRRRPDPSAVSVAQDLYGKLLATERAASGPREALAAGGALLGQVLSEMGKTYDELVWAITPDG